MKTRVLFGALALLAVVAPRPALAARDFSRGNIEAVDWNVMQVAVRSSQGRVITYKVAPNASVKFTDCPECFPSPSLRDLAPPMYVHFQFEDLVTQMRAAGRTGRVTTIDKSRGEVGIDVNGRERFYRVENNRMLDRVKEGDRVTFDVETRNGREVVTTLER